MSGNIQAMIASYMAKKGIVVTSTISEAGNMDLAAGTASSYSGDIVYMSDNVAVMLYTTSNVVYASVLTISGTTITQGTPLSIVASGFGPRGGKLTGSTLLCSYLDGSGNPYTLVLTMSGTTLTKGTAVRIGTTAANGGAAVVNLVTTPTTQKGILCYGQNGGSAGTNVVLISVSGTTVTINNTLNYASATMNQGNLYIACISDTEVMGTYIQSTTGLYSMMFNISGTTISGNAGVRLTTTTTAIRSLRSTKDGTTAIVLVQDSGTPTGLKCSVLTSTGTSVSFGGYTASIISTSGTAADISMNTTTTGIVYYANGSNQVFYAAALVKSGTTISIGTSNNVYTAPTTSYGIAVLGKCTETTSLVHYGRPSVSTPMIALLTAST